MLRAVKLQLGSWKGLENKKKYRLYWISLPCFVAGWSWKVANGRIQAWRGYKVDLVWFSKNWFVLVVFFSCSSISILSWADLCFYFRRKQQLLQTLHEDKNKQKYVSRIWWSIYPAVLFWVDFFLHEVNFEFRYLYFTGEDISTLPCFQVNF